MTRPQPPADLLAGLGTGSPTFVPAPDLRDWMLATFVADDAPLRNDDHAHLALANLGVLWTNVANARQGRAVVGQAEFKPPAGSMGKWIRARAQAQLLAWFGEAPLDFLVTFDANYAAAASDEAFCALVEHELYHCGIAKDDLGGPKFVEATGLPVFCLRGHDIEEFVGVVARYGADATQTAAFVAAAMSAKPRMTEIGIACGSCGARV